MLFRYVMLAENDVRVSRNGQKEKEMKIVVIGDGKIGFTVTQALVKEGHDLVVIDNQSAALKQTEDSLDVQVLEGNGASVSIQKQAGVDHADLMIAVTEADETNLLCCMIARHLGCANTIARIRSPEYNEDVYLLKEGLGLSMVVNPERSTAKQISALLQYPSFLKREKFAKGRAEIVEMSVPSGGKLDGMVLSELYKSLRVHVLGELHNHFGIDVSDDAIRAAVEQQNEVSRLMQEIGSYRKLDNPTITGYEYHVIQLCTLACPKYLILPYLRETAEELKTREPDLKKEFRCKVVLAGSSATATATAPWRAARSSSCPRVWIPSSPSPSTICPPPTARALCPRTRCARAKSASRIWPKSTMPTASSSPPTSSASTGAMSASSTPSSSTATSVFPSAPLRRSTSTPPPASCVPASRPSLRA